MEGWHTSSCYEECRVLPISSFFSRNEARQPPPPTPKEHWQIALPSIHWEVQKITDTAALKTLNPKPPPKKNHRHPVLDQTLDPELKLLLISTSATSSSYQIKSGKPQNTLFKPQTQPLNPKFRNPTHQNPLSPETEVLVLLCTQIPKSHHLPYSQCGPETKHPGSSSHP